MASEMKVCKRMLRNLDSRVEDLERRLDDAGIPATDPEPEESPFFKVRGVDVYRGQGEINWSQVAMAGIKFAIIKVSEGQDYTDSRYKRNMLQAKAAGIKVNAYHFGTPHYITSGQDHIVDAEAEARDFLAALGGYHVDVITFASGRQAGVWLDLEKDVPNLNMPKCEEWILHWLAVVEEHIPAGLYTSDSWLEKHVGIIYHVLRKRPAGAERPFWVARYGPNNGQMPDPERYPPEAKVPSEWGTWDVWQYSSQGEITGIDTRCDLNTARIQIS